MKKRLDRFLWSPAANPMLSGYSRYSPRFCLLSWNRTGNKFFFGNFDCLAAEVKNNERIITVFIVFFVYLNDDIRKTLSEGFILSRRSFNISILVPEPFSFDFGFHSLAESSLSFSAGLICSEASSTNWRSDRVVFVGYQFCAHFRVVFFVVFARSERLSCVFDKF